MSSMRHGLSPTTRRSDAIEVSHELIHVQQILVLDEIPWCLAPGCWDGITPCV